MSESLRRVLIVRTGEGDPARVARSVRDAGEEAILLDGEPAPADVAAVAVQEDVARVVVVTAEGAAEPLAAALIAALAAEDAADIEVTTREP